MPSTQPTRSVAAIHIRSLLLAYGDDRAYRVLTLEEIAQDLSQLSKEAIRQGLDRLAEEDLVTKFAGRFCFNKPIPPELLREAELLITPSGTIRVGE